MKESVREQLVRWAEEYEKAEYFVTDPISFPRELKDRGAALQDIEIAALLCAHFAWGRREMIVRDCGRLMDEMQWRPYDYVMAGDWRSGEESIHRTIKWSEVAGICRRLYEWYSWHDSLESMNAEELRTVIFNRHPDAKAPNKKINLMRRWMVRRGSPVDLGLWTGTDPASLLVPLDVHVYSQAAALGITRRRQKDLRTAVEITDAFREIWPDDPVKGDFALFGYGVTSGGKAE